MDRLKDECPICEEKNIAKSKYRKFRSVLMTCCGTLICSSCIDKMKQSAAIGTPFSCPICRTLPPKSQKEDFDRTMNHVKLGRPWAQEKVAQFYKNGYGVNQSDAKAFEFFSLAAARGEPNAQYWVGNFYINGRGIAQSNEKALPFLQKATDQGISEAQGYLGICYQYGLGIEKSSKKAFQLFLRAAEGGCIESCNHAGFCYFNGDGVQKDYEKAIYYFTLAAENDNKYAQFELGGLYGRGEGVKQCLVKAFYWVRQCLKDNEDEELCAGAKESLDYLLLLSSFMCSSCGHKAKLHLKCSKCMSAYYCNINCQTKHWKNGHKQECKKP